MPPVMRSRPARWLADVGGTISRSNLVDLAAQLAYYWTLALFPFAIFLVAVLGFLPVGGVEDEIFGVLRRMMPHDAEQLVEQTIRQVTAVKRHGLLWLALGVTVFTASSGVSALMTTLNAAYEVKETRSWPRRKLTAIAITIVSTVLVAVAGAAMLIGPELVRRVMAFFHLVSTFDRTWALLRYPSMAAAIALLLAFLYWACPNVKQRPWQLLPGAFLGVALWIGASLGFDVYAAKLGNFPRTYGALATAIVLLTWIYLTCVIVLVGGVVNGVSWRRRRERAQGIAPAVRREREVPSLRRRPGDDRPLPQPV